MYRITCEKFNPVISSKESSTDCTMSHNQAMFKVLFYTHSEWHLHEMEAAVLVPVVELVEELVVLLILGGPVSLVLSTSGRVLLETSLFPAVHQVQVVVSRLKN